MNRREFLALTATGILNASSTAKKVIIAGGGLSGLVCGYELRKRGFEVVVLEGQGRPGGRVQTLREGLYPGLTAETGATRIPDTHELTLAYVREFGLPLEPFKGGNLADVVHLRGRTYVQGKGAPEPDWPLPLRPDEKRRGRESLLQQYLADPLKLAKGSESSPEVPASILALDRYTILGYLQQQGLSPAAIELMTLGADKSVSLALLLLVEFNEQVRREFFHIRGGNDQLPAAFATQLKGAVRYGCRVVGIGQDDRSAWVAVDHAGTRETLRGDCVVSALPFSVARNLFSNARLSSDKQRVIRDQKYFPVNKVFLQMQKQFWKAKGQSGFASTDLLNERFWSLGSNSAEERGLLLSYVIGANAARLDEMDMERRIDVTLSDAEKVFPGAREHFEGARVKSWMQDPWQRGGLSAFAPGELSFIPISARREGRIFFAGEHSSRWNGWMQGAIESGQRVVKEICSFSGISAA